jgi:hypothetical protein
VYALTTLPVYLGLTLATVPGVLEHNGPPPDFLHACCHYDGGHFQSIVQNGHSYEAVKGNTVAFFPGYPLTARGVSQLTGWSTKLALVATSNVAFAVTLILLSAYLRLRDPDEPLASRLTVLALIGLWPVSYFYRMAYSESLFLVTLALLLLGFARRWPVVVLAFVAGAATGIRSVGLGATAAVVVYVLSDPERGPIRKRLVTAAALVPVGCWGMLAFMAYQYARFDTPIAFIVVQQHWAFHTPQPGDIPTKFLRLALAEPLWNAYVPGSSRHWVRFDQHGVPMIGIMFWNPIFFAITAAAVAFGWYRGWLTRPEAALGFLLLFIPYVTRADEMSMGSHARFAAVAIPAYVVLGRVLGRLPPFVTWVVFAAFATVLALWSALFAAQWPLC